MKRKLQIIISASAVSILAFPALAQNTPNPAPDGMGHNPDRWSHAQHLDRLNEAAKASDVIGMTIKNYQGEKLGKVEEIAVDVESGRIVQVIVATGGFLGLGHSLTAVPPGAFQHDADEKVLHLDVSKEKLKAASRFDLARWDESTRSNQVTEVYSYYGERPYFIANRDMDTISNADISRDAASPRNMDGTINTSGNKTMDKVYNAEVARTVEDGTANTETNHDVTSPRNMDGTINTAGNKTMDKAYNAETAGDVANGTTNADTSRYTALPQNMDGTINAAGTKTVEKVRNAEIARNAEETSQVVSTRNPDGTWTRVRYSNGSAASASWPTLGYVEKASKLMGMPVRNQQDQKLGKVENLILDLSTGRIVAIIISSGGFIGMGDELSAVPPAALRFDAAHDTLQLDTTREMLTRSPHFKSRQWPDLSQPVYAGEVYRAYNVEPYFNTDATVAVDNTRRNVRDRDQSTLTPMDQGNSKADLNITARIRKEIIADKGMSVNAKNVKIITKNGQVTLRGPVNSAEEKQLIGEIANRIASSGNVNNELEVKLTTSSND